MASEDERERLFQMFHDLVDEALVQYADGFAVDLEGRYYELADELIADRTELEQQLAQARALLAGINHILQYDIDYDAVTDWQDQYRAWNAQHKEQSRV